ncbi:hypothetical protein GCM10020331_087510 [Ectobacillus funiculus]
MGLGDMGGYRYRYFFATKDVNPAGNNGLLYGNPEQLLHQLVGVSTAILLAIVGTFTILKVISLFLPLRVSMDEELMGLDLSFHEESAYNTIQSVDVNTEVSKSS